MSALPLGTFGGAVKVGSEVDQKVEKEFVWVADPRLRGEGL